MDRSEHVPKRGHDSNRLRRIAGPFNEKHRDYGPSRVNFNRIHLLSAGLLILLLVSWPPALILAAGIEANNTKPAPSTKHSSTTTSIIGIVQNECYRDRPLDDELSAEILEGYLNSLDPDRNIFLEEDITAFAHYKRRFDVAMQDGDMEPMFEIFGVFQTRLEQRTYFADKLLQKTLEFDTDETYSPDRNNLPWATNRLESDELWRKRIKNDGISLRLSGQESAQVSNTLRMRYKQLNKHTAQLQPDEVYQIFINAYLSLLDPHSAYFLPRRLRRNRDTSKPPLEGIGVQLRRDKDHAVVKRIFAGGSADKSGQLHRGDRIVGVADGADGEMTDVVAWTLDDIVSLIRGPKGSIVRLRILPKGTPLQGSHRLVTLSRDRIRLEELRVKKSIIQISKDDKRYRIGVIHVPRFYLDYAAYGRGAGNFLSTTRDAERLIVDLQQEKIDGLIIDLRGNQGGALLEATRLTGLFIESGPVVQVKDATKHVEVHRDSDSRIVYSGPLAVLVDRYSASASEIFAGAIQDYRRGLILGEPTYGKGTVQQTIDLNRSTKDANATFGQLVITVAQYFRVNGNSTQIRGVLPDIVLPAHPRLNESGEGTETNALPWEHISSVAFKPIAKPVVVTPQIRKRHLMRLQDIAPFREALEAAQDGTTDHTSNKVSLNLEKRRRQKETNDRERRDRENGWRRALGLKPLSKTEVDDGQLQKRWADKVLTETAEILGDAIDEGRGEGASM